MTAHIHLLQPAGRRLILGLSLLLSATGASAPPEDPGGRPLTIVSIGRAGIDPEPADSGPRAPITTYYVHAHERLVVRVATGLPVPSRLYPLVRRDGETTWHVQPPAVGPRGGKPAAAWTAEIALGNTAESGARFEVEVIAAAEPLPQLLSPGMKASSALAESAVVQVERLLPKPSVGIGAILAVAPGDLPAAAEDPQYVQGDAELMVHDLSLVQVVSDNVPAGAQVTVVVESAASGNHWVMADTTAARGLILAHFDTPDASELSFHFQVSAVVTWDDSSLPTDRAISASDWQHKRAQILAESRAVRVVRWQRELEIEQIGLQQVQSGQTTLLIDRQLDVRGAARRRLETGEQIWLACVPLQGGLPWIAGHTSRLTPSGHWTVKAAQLWRDAGSQPFDLLAVVASGKPGQLLPAALRTILGTIESGDRSARVSVAPHPTTAGPSEPH